MPLEDPWPAPTATGPISATITLPGSKSLTNRALVLCALATGPAHIRGALRSRDTELMAAALTGLGSVVDTSGPVWPVHPGAWSGDTQVDCGLAGTVTRFLPPTAGLNHGSVGFDGDARMRRRPVGEVLTALRQLGVEVIDQDRGALPFLIRGTGTVPGGRVVIDASASSQFVSGLLLSGARYTNGVDVRHAGKPIPSLPHIQMTIEMLRKHGVDVDDQDANRWAVAPGPIQAVDHDIEPDLSNAAPFLALAAVTGGSVSVPRWPARTTQAGDALRDILTAMGCRVEMDQNGLTVSGPEQLAGIDLDLHDVGELTPAVAALCALAGGPSYLRGVAHIREHETDRLAALAKELTALGGLVTEHADGLEIRPAHLHGGVVGTYHDHRMAHAAVILGAAVPGIRVQNIATTAKTFPGFADHWAGLFRDCR